jgi:hypothetical protein
MLRISRRHFRRPSLETVALLEVRIVLAGPDSPADLDDADSQEPSRAEERQQRQEDRQQRRSERLLRREERRNDLAGSTPSSEPEVLEDEGDAVENEDNTAGPVDGVRPQVERSHRDAAIVSVVDPRAFQEPLPSPPEVITPVEATLPAPPVEILGFIGEDAEPAEPPEAETPAAPPEPPAPVPAPPSLEIPPLDELPPPAEILASVPDVTRIPQGVSARLPTLPRTMPSALLPLPGPLGSMPVEVSGLLDDLFEVFFEWFADPEAN